MSVDDTFGQQPAFPLEGSDEVLEYLLRVRREAEKDTLVFYVERDAQPEQEMQQQDVGADDGQQQDNGQDQQDVLADWKREVVSMLLKMKQEPYPKEPRPFSVPATANLWRKYIMENDPPALGVFHHDIDHTTVFKLVVYITKWLSVSTNEHLSKWVWMLFVRIDNVMDANETSVVRDLAKKALKLQPKATTEVSRFTMEMVVEVVGNYYGQRDLLW